MTSFFVTLPSYTRPEFPDNKPNKYKVRLPHRLPLEGDDWKVTLTSISLPSNPLIVSLFQLGNTEKLVEYWYRPQVRDLSTVSSTFYKDNVNISELKTAYQAGVIYDSLTFLDWLLDALQIKITNSVGLHHEVKSSDKIDFTWEKNAHTPYMMLAQHERLTGNAKVYFHKDLALLLKWIVQHPTTKVYSLGPNMSIQPYPIPSGRPMRLHSLSTRTHFKVEGNYLELSNMYSWKFNPLVDDVPRPIHVYSNVGKSTIVGDQVTDLLRDIHYVPKRTANVHFEPLHLRYHEVRNKDIEIIEIQLAEINGTLLSIPKGDTSVTLHFKKG